MDYLRLTPATKEAVDEQIGSEEASREFFETFEFRHSMQRYDEYEEYLRSQLEHDTDSHGWAHFRQQVRHWAMRKHAPRPDGKIRHFHLLQVFSRDRPVALRQDFAVPPNYRVPDDAFHQGFTVEATTADGVAVLWGPPGRGKSTYLSHCASELAAQDNVVCIRHHYFSGSMNGVPGDSATSPSSGPSSSSWRTRAYCTLRREAVLRTHWRQLRPKCVGADADS